MIGETIHSNGKNNYIDNTYSSEEWSAPIMISPEEIKRLIASFNLEGRIIRRMRTIDLAFNFTREWIEERAYSYFHDLDEKERQIKSEYAHIPPEVTYSRYVEIDTPFMIEFEDGDIFEIDTPQEPEFMMSMNSIPWDIKSDTSAQNLDLNILFSPCIGKKIEKVEVKTYTTDKDPMDRKPFDEQKSQHCFVSAIILRFEDGTGLLFEGCFDFCHVVYIDQNKYVGLITFDELRPALFNPEDLHTDMVTGYEADSCTFKFGELGAAHTEAPYITLIPSHKDSRLQISVEDFLLFDWSITIYTNTSFDEYGEYEFTCSQWNGVLQIAKKIISFSTFDELFEYMKSINASARSTIGGHENSITLKGINHFGAEFWKRMIRFRTQYEDMSMWSKLALSPDDSMKICGTCASPADPAHPFRVSCRRAPAAAGTGAASGDPAPGPASAEKHGDRLPEG